MTREDSFVLYNLKRNKISKKKMNLVFWINILPALQSVVAKVGLDLVKRRQSEPIKLSPGGTLTERQ
jgi:hypothetical protein